MAKPILIITAPVGFTSETMGHFKESIKSEIGTDYFVICMTGDVTEFKFLIIQPAIKIDAKL